MSTTHKQLSATITPGMLWSSTPTATTISQKSNKTCIQEGSDQTKMPIKQCSQQYKYRNETSVEKML
jgi:hypothetical protein